MYGALVVALLFLAGVAYNILGPEPDTTEAVGGALIAAALLGVFFLARRHEQRTAEFANWLVGNADAINRGSARYEGTPITPATVLTQYQIVLSFLIVTFRIPTRFYIVGVDRTATVSVTASLISLVLGWWGIPWGPLYTIQAVAKNVRGGLRFSVGERLVQIAALSAPH